MELVSLTHEKRLQVAVLKQTANIVKLRDLLEERHSSSKEVDGALDALIRSNCDLAEMVTGVHSFAFQDFFFLSRQSIPTEELAEEIVRTNVSWPDAAHQQAMREPAEA